MQLVKHLKSGQVAMFFKLEDSCVLYPGKKLHYLDFVIGDDEDYCLNWYKELNDAAPGEVDTNVTGTGSIEGLLFALETVQELQKHLTEGEVLIVQPTDEKRFRAYKRLLKYGFKQQRNHFTYSR